MDLRPVSRRSLLLGAAGVAVAVPVLPAAAQAVPEAGRTPLWQQAARKGIVFGSSIASWQLDETYPALFAREAGLLFTEDDLLWYQLKPTPTAPVNFAPGDQIVAFAEANRQLTIGAHL